jgi:hypothetical protein
MPWKILSPPNTAGESVSAIPMVGNAIRARAIQRKYRVLIPRQLRPIKGLDTMDTRKNADTINPICAIEAFKVSLA